MLYLSMSLLIFFLISPVVADDSCVMVNAVKSADHIGANPVSDAREGGEDISDALPISSIPFWDTGATCDNIDDDDEVCPYQASTSPDVVYVISGGFGSDVYLFLDLCGSAYDTKLYVYDEDLNLIECNDDFYFDDICGFYVSAIEDLMVCADETVYIVVDGYGGDCGEYVLNINEHACPVPPVLECPPDGMLEGEPQLCDGYVDSYNGGCDAESTTFQHLVAPPGQSELSFCGISGWFEIAGDLQRDTDWFDVIATGSQIAVTTVAEQFMEIESLIMNDCGDVVVDQTWTMVYWPETVIIDTSPGQIVHLRVQLQNSEPSRCVDMYAIDYHMQFSGISSVTAVATTSWGGVKALYR